MRSKLEAVTQMTELGLHQEFSDGTKDILEPAVELFIRGDWFIPMAIVLALQGGLHRTTALTMTRPAQGDTGVGTRIGLS